MTSDPCNDGSGIQAVVLDLDDTLFDHQTSARRGVARLVCELGARPGPEIIKAWESTAEELMARRHAGEIDRAGYRRGRVTHLLRDLGRGAEAAGLSDADRDRLYGRYVELYEEEWVGFADAVPTLKALRERELPVAVLTNGPEERQQRKVRAIGIAPWVVGVWTSGRLAARKPETTTYLRVCEALGTDPRAVLHVGDNIEHDLDGALAAGLRALHLDRRRELASSPQRITGLAEILDRL